MRKSHVLGVTSLALLAWLLVALAFVWARTARADETAVGYTNADTTLYVAPNALGQGSCASAANACTPAGAVAAIHNTPLLKNRVKVVFAAGSYSNNAVDWFVQGTGVQGTPYLALQGTYATPTLDGGITSGRCNWTSNAVPVRATCNAGADGGWAPSGLVPFWARLGGVNSTFPNGTCGTYQVESNTASTMTLELTSTSAGPGIPSGCSGSVPFAIVDNGTHFYGSTATVVPQLYPANTLGLPDGGGLNDFISPATERVGYQMAISAADGQLPNVFVDGIDFNPGDAGASKIGVRVGPNVNGVFSNNHFWVGSARMAVLGDRDDSLMFLNNRLDRQVGLSTGGALVGSNSGHPLAEIRGSGNTSVNSAWLDARAPMTWFQWATNYLDTPGGGNQNGSGGYYTQGIRRAKIYGDIVTDAGSPWVFQWANDTPSGFATRASSTVLELSNSKWEGTGSAGPHTLGPGPGDRWYLSGANSLSFPSANAIFCPDYSGSVEISGGANTFSATNFADFSVGCSGGNFKSLAQVDAGISCGQGAAQPCLCGPNAGEDGGIGTLGSYRQGCIQLFTP